MSGIDVVAVEDVLVDRVRRVFPDDVALVCRYGSYARGTATARSDLDVFFIPATDRGREAAVAVLVGGVTVDFWAIDWEWLERSARLEERGAPIVAEAQILYARSSQDRERFEGLRRSLRAIEGHGDPLHYTELSHDRLQSAYPPLHRLRSAAAAGDLTAARRAVVEIISVVCSAVALLNRTYLRSGAADQIEELRDLPLTPVEVVPSFSHALESEDLAEVVAACERSVEATDRVLTQRHRTLAPTPALDSSAIGFFEELRGLLEKIRSACEADDHRAALFTAVSVEHEVDGLVGASDRPDLVPLARPGELTALLRATDALEEWLRRRLATAGVPVRELATPDDLRDQLARLDPAR